MTQKTSSADRRRAPLVTPRYMLGTAKRGWALAVLFFIVFMLFFTVQAMTEISDFADTIRSSSSHYSHADRLDVLGNYIYVLRATFVILSSASAIFAGCYFFSFVHNKTSAGFFHSLPERRSGHFVSAIFGAAATYLIGAVSNFIFVVFIFAANGFLYAELILPLLSIVFFGVFYFLVFLSFTALAGTVSGNTAIHAIMTCFLLLFLPALYLACLILVNYGATYLSVSSMMIDIEAYKWLSPIFRAVYVLSDIAKSGATPALVLIILDVLLTAVLFALAYYAYTKRPIERSGTPIIFGWLSETVKYIIMAPSAVFMSTIFNALIVHGGYAWAVFGFLAGLFISYMLCNTVLNRSAKAMFSHVRGMLIYSASCCLASIFLIFGCFGIFDYAVPAASNMEIYIGGQQISLDDKGEVDLVRGAIKKYVDDLREGEISYDYSYRYDDEKIAIAFDEYADGITRSASMRVYYTTPLGTRLEYSYDHVPNDYKNVIIGAVIQCDSFFEKLSPEPAVLSEIQMDVYASTSQVLSYDAEEYPYISDGIIGSLSNKIVNMNINIHADPYRDPNKDFTDEFIRIFSPESADFFQHPSIGTYAANDRYNYRSNWNGALYFENLRELLIAGSKYFSTGEYDISAYAFSDIFNFDNAMIDAGHERMAELSADDYFDGIADAVTEIAVYSKKTGKTKYFTGSEIRDILPHLASVTGAPISPLTRTDDTYVVRVTANSIINEEPDINVTWFLDGEIPEFVK